MSNKEFIFSQLFLEITCDKNAGGTRNLSLRGNDLMIKVGRRLDNGDLQHVICFLKKNPDVIALDLAYNRIGNCGVHALMCFIQNNPNLLHLNLICNEIGVQGIKYIVSLGDKLPLQTLRLSGNKFGREGGKVLSELLYKNIPLKTLDLSDTHQDISSLAYIMTGLISGRGGADTLQLIDIGRPEMPYYQTMCSAHVAEFIGQVLRGNTGLRELRIQQYQFDSHDIEIMLHGLMKNNTLECLDLNNNNIGDDGVAHLCKYLDTRPSLKYLKIAANKINDLGATSLSRSLPNSKIKLLDLTNNNLTDEGIINLLYTIRKPFITRAFFIWGNHLTCKSLTTLERMLLAGTLEQDLIDIKLYKVDDELHAAWYPSSNKYTHLFYCVSECPRKKYEKSLEQPMLNFRHYEDTGLTEEFQVEG